MGRGDDRAHARFVAGDRRKRDSLSKYALFEQAIRQLHRAGAFARDDGRDGTFTEARVEAERREAFLEEARVVPEPLDDLGLVLEHIKGGQTAGGH